MQEKVEACEDLDMMSPYKEKKHLKWCLLDEGETDFNKLIPGPERTGPLEKFQFDSNVRHAKVFQM